MMRYFKLADDGTIISSYSVEQKGLVLVYAEEPKIDFPVWDGRGWVSDNTKISRRDMVSARSDLRQIDLDSIRSMREYLVTLKDCPEILKQHEKDAKEKRKYTNHTQGDI